MASALGVPESIREIAGSICQRAQHEGVVRGWSVEGVASGALYVACRRCGSPRSLDEVTAVSRVDRREIGRTFKRLGRELGIDLEPPHPQTYVARFCSDLDLPERLLREARIIIDRAADAGLLSGKSPTGYAGAAVFAAGLVDGRDLARQEVAAVAGVTPTTIETRAREQLVVVGDDAVADGLVGDGDLPADWASRIDTSGRAAEG
jgi:transcription initiation factor TFIIB